MARQVQLYPFQLYKVIRLRIIKKCLKESLYFVNAHDWKCSVSEYLWLLFPHSSPKYSSGLVVWLVVNEKHFSSCSNRNKFPPHRLGQLVGSTFVQPISVRGQHSHGRKSLFRGSQPKLQRYIFILTLLHITHNVSLYSLALHSRIMVLLFDCFIIYYSL